MGTMYIGIGVFEHLRRGMNKEFKRVGISKMIDKRGYFMQVLKEAPAIKSMSVSQMEMVIESLRKLPDAHFAHLIEESIRERKEPNPFSVYVKEKRDAIGWSNHMFHAMTGISSYRLARIATGTLDATPDEEAKIRSVFNKWDNEN